MTTQGAAYEIRFCKDNIVQVFDLSKRNDFNEQKLPYEYDEDDVIHGRLRYSKLLGTPSSPPPALLTEQQESLPLRKRTRAPQEIVLQVDNQIPPSSCPSSTAYTKHPTRPSPSGSFSSSSSTCYTKNTPIAAAIAADDASDDTESHDHSMPVMIPPSPHIHHHQLDDNKDMVSRPDRMDESSNVISTSPVMSQCNQYQPSIVINPPKPALYPITYQQHQQYPSLPIDPHEDMRRHYEMEEKREAVAAAGCCCIIC